MKHFHGSFVVRRWLRVLGAAGAALLFVLPSAVLAQTAARARAAPAATTPAPVENPYLAIVPAENETDATRDKSLRLALVEVLRRAAGKRDAAFTPILARSASLVQHYGFERDALTGALSFRAAFDPVAIDTALKQQGLPVFGLNSELVEAWITEVSGVRTAADYARVIDHFSRLRGVRRVDVAEVRDDAVRLRMIVEGGMTDAAALAVAGGVVRADPYGNHELVR